MAKADNEGLSLGYRFRYRIRRMGAQMFGPAQLGDDQDPLVKLERERAAKVARAREARQGREGRA